MKQLEAFVWEGRACCENLCKIRLRINPSMTAAVIAGKFGSTSWSGSIMEELRSALRRGWIGRKAKILCINTWQFNYSAAGRAAA